MLIIFINKVVIKDSKYWEIYILLIEYKANSVEMYYKSVYLFPVITLSTYVFIHFKQKKTLFYV